MARSAPPAEDSATTDAKKKAKVANDVAIALRDKHREEWEEMMVEAHKAAGLSWSPRLRGDAAKIARLRKQAAELGLEVVTVVEVEQAQVLS